MRQANTLLLVTSLFFLVACGGKTASEAPPAPAPKADITEAPAPQAPAVVATPLALQAVGSELTFSARKNDEADVGGTFTRLSGTLLLPGDDLSQARGSLSVGWVGGVDTKDPARDLNLVTAFFGALDDSAPKGSVSLNSLEVKKPKLAVGESTTGNAFVDVGAGRSMTGLALPVRIERIAAAQYRFTVTEPGAVSIDKLGMNDRKAALITLCQHQSVGDAVTVGGTFVFGQ